MGVHRIEWIEFAKAITMFLVIFDHLGLRDTNGYGLLHLPLSILLFKVFYRQLFHVTMPSPYFDTFSAIIAALLIELLMIPFIIGINRFVPILNGSKH